MGITEQSYDLDIFNDHDIDKMKHNVLIVNHSKFKITDTDKECLTEYLKSNNEYIDRVYFKEEGE